MRILVISPATKAAAEKVVNYAKKRNNWYDPSRPGWLNRVPGDDRNHQCLLSTYRCVFSYTVDSRRKRVFRHLSISVPSENMPNPAAVVEIAKMFGFTGVEETQRFVLPPDWMVRVKRDHPVDDDCIVIGQDVEIDP